MTTSPYKGWKPDPFAFQRGVFGPRGHLRVSPGLTDIVAKAKKGGAATDEEVAALCTYLRPREHALTYDICAAACCVAMLEVKPEHRVQLEGALLEALHYAQNPGDPSIMLQPAFEDQQITIPLVEALRKPSSNRTAIFVKSGLLIAVVKLILIAKTLTTGRGKIDLMDIAIVVVILVLCVCGLDTQGNEVVVRSDWTQQVPECIVRALEHVGSPASIVPLLELIRRSGVYYGNINHRVLGHLLSLPRSPDFTLNGKAYTPVLCTMLHNCPVRFHVPLLDVIGQFGNASALKSLTPFVGPGHRPEVLDAAHRAQAAIQVRERLTKDARHLLRATDAPASLLTPAEQPIDVLLRPAGSAPTPEHQLLRPTSE